MRIFIDGFEANVPQRLGSSQVAFELLKNLEKIDKNNKYTILLSSTPLEDLPKERPGWKYKTLKVKRFKTYIGIPHALFTSKERPDVVFSPTHYAPIVSPVKRVMMVFDLSFLRFPKMFKPRDLYQLKLWTKISVKGAEKIITISESTKKDIEKFYGISDKKISIAYPGFDPGIFYPIKDKEKIDEVLKKYKISSPFVIFIGTVQPRKNLIRLIEAFKEIKEVNLVVVGKIHGTGRQAWMFEEILNAPKKFGVEEKVRFTDFVPSEDLPYLLNGALCYCLPSLFEGFGIPAVEAMACGTPVIVSNASSLPEVVGDAGLLVDPLSPQDIAEKINRVYLDKKLREDLSKRGLERAKSFSWKKMAREVLGVLEEVGSEG